jgi:hypothetical protein
MEEDEDQNADPIHTSEIEKDINDDPEVQVEDLNPTSEDREEAMHTKDVPSQEVVVSKAQTGGPRHLHESDNTDPDKELASKTNSGNQIAELQIVLVEFSEGG